MDLYLKFSDEQQAKDVLYTKVATAFDYTDPENPVPTEWYDKPNYANIDTIGVIYEGGEWDAEGNVITEPTALDGWHCNVRVVAGENADALAPYKIDVSTPMRVWG